MNDTDYYSTDLNLDNLNETKEIISFNNYLSFDMESDENYALNQVFAINHFLLLLIYILTNNTIYMKINISNLI